MKRARTKREQAEQTRARILDAAIRLFARRGFASTSTQDLARAIGMTPGILYWHFKGKEDLLVAVLDELQRRLIVELADQAQESADRGAVWTLSALIDRVARVVERHQENLLLVGVIGAEATDTNPRVERAVRAAYRRVSSWVVEVLRGGVAEGVIPRDLDLACATQMFLGLYMGGIMHQRLFRQEYPLPRALPVLRRLLFSALVPAEAARRGRGQGSGARGQRSGVRRAGK